MLKRAFSIRFAISEDVEGVTLHEVRNFGEDLQRWLERERLGTVENTDTANDEIFVSLSSPSHRGHARLWINEMLDRHSLRDISTVTEE